MEALVNNVPNEPLMTPAEMADKLKVSQRTVQDLARSGQLRSIRVGKHYRFTSAHYKAFLATGTGNRKRIR